MRHIVDEVVLYLGVAFLPEDNYDCEDERHEQHECEGYRRNHESNRREDVRTHVGEVDAHNAHLRLRVVAEQYLRVGELFAFVCVIRTAIYLASVLCADGKVVWYVHSVVHQLCFEVLIEQLEVDAFLKRTFRSGVEYRVDHLVEQRLLIDVAVLYYFLQRL